MSARIMGGIALSLGLPEQYFEDLPRCVGDDATAALSAAAGARPARQGRRRPYRLGRAHAAAQDDAGGLQVWEQARGWLQRPCPTRTSSISAT